MIVVLFFMRCCLSSHSVCAISCSKTEQLCVCVRCMYDNLITWIIIFAGCRRMRGNRHTANWRRTLTEKLTGQNWSDSKRTLTERSKS